MKLRIIGYLVFSALLLSIGACTKSCKKTPPSDDQAAGSAFFVSPKDGDVVTSPVSIEFGVAGMTVRPALEDINDKTSGHHHLLIDSPSNFIEAGQVIPADAKSIHYGQGETTATVELTPGVHKLTAQFGDGGHKSLGEKFSQTITITVTDSAQAADAGEDSFPEGEVEDVLE